VKEHGVEFGLGGGIVAATIVMLSKDKLGTDGIHIDEVKKHKLVI
jgi:hypothetical protein